MSTLRSAALSPARSARSARAGLLLVSGGALLWGTTGLGAAIVTARAGLSAVTIGWYRVAIAAAVAVPAVLVLQRGGMRRAWAAFRRRPVTLLAAGVTFGAYQALYFRGAQYAGVGVATLLSLGVAPLALTAGAAIARRRRPRVRSLAVLGCALTGLLLVALRPGEAGTSPALGIVLSVGSGLGYALCTGLTRRLPDQTPLVLTAATSTVATVFLLPLALVSGLTWPGDAVSAGWLLYIGVIPTVVAYWLFYRGLRTTPAEVAGVITLLEPLAAAVLALVVLHEPVTALAVIGASLMLLAIAALYVGDT